MPENVRAVLAATKQWFWMECPYIDRSYVKPRKAIVSTLVTVHVPAAGRSKLSHVHRIDIETVFYHLWFGLVLANFLARKAVFGNLQFDIRSTNASLMITCCYQNIESCSFMFSVVHSAGAANEMLFSI